ncbi:hypothetical protein H6P81_006957 [Aristolochia fimbriata]|uniref:Uncharacterized protein n=1 Tax=Aristolochia fimbriata TaxID=158543 RepID=A0AAV7F3A6_ARIFI|nr:hypothetical protein H6P81_006957 [Aristolochia fimbriata]
MTGTSGRWERASPSFAGKTKTSDPENSRSNRIKERQGRQRWHGEANSLQLDAPLPHLELPRNLLNRIPFAAEKLSCKCLLSLFNLLPILTFCRPILTLNDAFLLLTSASSITLTINHLAQRCPTSFGSSF